MDVIAGIDAARERWNVLEHPFYTRWEQGELTREELAPTEWSYVALGHYHVQHRVAPVRERDAVDVQVAFDAPRLARVGPVLDLRVLR